MAFFSGRSCEAGSDATTLRRFAFGLCFILVASHTRVFKDPVCKIFTEAQYLREPNEQHVSHSRHCQASFLKKW